MKRIVSLLCAVGFVAVSFAQTLNVNQGAVSYAYPAAQMSEAVASSSAITIGKMTYNVGDITNITVDNSEVADNSVSVVYSGSSAKVVIAGNVAHLVSASVRGAHVTLLQSADAKDEITYTLSGSSNDGSLYMNGKLKATFVFDGLSLTNPDSCAVNIQDGKRIAIVLAAGKTNTLTDGIKVADDGSDAHKACFYVDGHPEFEGTGSLTVNGNVKHGFCSDEYTKFKASMTGTVNVVTTNGDALHIGQYFMLNGGNLNVVASGDGIDVGMKKDTTVENNGQLIIAGGKADIRVSGPSSDAMKCEGEFTMTGGNLSILATGDGGRVLSSDGKVSISGGTLSGAACGKINAADEDRKAHGIKTDFAIEITGGEVYVAASSEKGVALKTDDAVYLNGGTLMGIGGKDFIPYQASLKTSTLYSNVNVTSGATVSYNGVSFTVPAEYSNSKAYVRVVP